jgi:UDP-2-acetamido-2,6-beta-L-arabino-hexul-4-ose reductase
MIKVGITGGNGFIGYHLLNRLNLLPEFKIIEFNRHFFENEISLDTFTKECDIIIHLAALNRHNDDKVIYDTNVNLVKKLITSCSKNNSCGHIIFTSSSQEDNDSTYGKSKKDGRILFRNWAKKYNKNFTGLIIPNVFGPFGMPYYNSVISTFSHQLINNETPQIHVDKNLKLIYVGNLIDIIIKNINNKHLGEEYKIPYTIEKKVSEISKILSNFKTDYLTNNSIPKLQSRFELNLFNSFRSHIDNQNYFPVKYKNHTDERGNFVELIKLGCGGQFSFSTTKQGVIRGNHFHTRKIERFSVIKGKALIQMRKINTNEIIEFNLDGANPSYVDIPIWYTHNIKNIGNDMLYTNFWINEIYNPVDPDTYFENV